MRISDWSSDVCSSDLPGADPDDRVPGEDVGNPLRGVDAATGTRRAHRRGARRAVAGRGRFFAEDVPGPPPPRLTLRPGRTIVAASSTEGDTWPATPAAPSTAPPMAARAGVAGPASIARRSATCGRRRASPASTAGWARCSTDDTTAE